MTNRTQRLKDRLFANPREISLERALLYTASHKQTEGEPVMIRRAKATAWVLDHVQISIRDDELIAGNRTIKPRAGIMSPEMDPYWLLKELDQFPTRPQDRFNISEEDKRIYREELFPYWENRSMKDFIPEICYAYVSALIHQLEAVFWKSWKRSFVFSKIFRPTSKESPLKNSNT